MGGNVEMFTDACKPCNLLLTTQDGELAPSKQPWSALPHCTHVQKSIHPLVDSTSFFVGGKLPDRGG